MTGATGYFAQNQTSLDGLTKNVFGALAYGLGTHPITVAASGAVSFASNGGSA